MLEDYYDNNPSEIDRFIASMDANEAAQANWNGQMPAIYEEAIAKRLKKINERNKVDIKKYQSEEVLSPEQEESILENLGKNLPKSRVLTKRVETEDSLKTLGDNSSDEFEDDF